MGKRSFIEVLDALLDGLDTLHDEPFTIPELISASGLKGETARKLLDIIEKIQRRGFLLRVKNNPRIYMWIPNRSIEELLAMKFFQILMIKESLTLEELEEKYGLSPENAEKIMRLLVDRKLARWAGQDIVALYPLDYYLNLASKESDEFYYQIKKEKLMRKA